MKIETKPVVYNTPEETELMIQNLRSFLREKTKELEPWMVHLGYKIKGVNC